MDKDNVVVFYNWFGGINGSLINAFEYFITIFEHTDVHLLLINCSSYQLNKLLQCIENRYNLNDINYRDNIWLMNKPYELVRFKFKNALVVDYSTIQKTKGLLRADKIIVISELYTDDTDYMYDKKLQNIIYYGEMPFVYKDIQYKMKMMFHRFKKPKEVKEGLYINIPCGDADDFGILDEIHLPDKPRIFKSGIHLENMFEHFDTYAYLHANKWFDPHPRLFHECVYMGKKIIYYNPKNVKDGSYYRIVDLVDNQDLNERFLDENDEVVREFL